LLDYCLSKDSSATKNGRLFENSFSSLLRNNYYMKNAHLQRALSRHQAGQLRTNKSATLFSHPDGSPVVSLACSSDGAAVASGHADGSIYQYVLDDGGSGAAAMRIAQHGTRQYFYFLSFPVD
jgi:hypothetical protein